jgi:CBS domain-containing protein
MTKDPITVTTDNTIEDCMNIMSDKRIRHLPVVEDGHLVGMISIGDLVKHIIEEQKSIIEHLEHYITH